MGTAYTMALPPATLPVMGGVIAAVGWSLLYTVLLVVFAIVLGVIVQNALARPSRRQMTIRLVTRDTTSRARQPA
jgi:hypothetical protein